MRVLVTGGAGFIGSHVTELLLQRAMDVLVVDDLSTGMRDNLPAGAPLAVLDITDAGRLEAVVREHAPEAVVHLAADADVARSVLNPMHDAMVNLVGTVSVLQAASAAGCRRVVFASTSAVYGEPRHQPVSEDDPMDPISPYGVSKSGGEQYIRVLSGLRGMSYAILRLGNVFGPRDAPKTGHVISSFIDALGRDQAPVIEWDGEQAKDFVYVADVAAAVLAAVEDTRSDVYNIATGRSRTVNALLAAVCAAIGRDVEPRRAPKRAGDVRRFVMSSEKAQRQLGWTAAAPFEAALRATVDDRLARLAPRPLVETRGA